MMNKVVLYSNNFNPAWLPYAEHLLNLLFKYQFEVLITENLAPRIFDKVELNTYAIPVIPEEQIALQKPDVVLTIGGDGTLLSCIQYIKNTQIPLMGINTGRLGFLASVSKDELEKAILLLKNNRFVFDKRTLIQIKSPSNLFQSVNFALNELTIHKNQSSSMITIHAYVDGQYLNSYWADGLIISTPTGSTAYSLSCGGPIVLADTETFIITPIAPHNLNVRPMVISDKKEVKLKIEGRSNNFLLSLDSHASSITSDVEILVAKADFTINLLKLEGQTFFDTIRNKLLWGLDKRN